MSDLITYLKATAGKLGDQFNLSQLAPGDELRVATNHTEYVFKIIEGPHRGFDVLAVRSATMAQKLWQKLS